MLEQNSGCVGAFIVLPVVSNFNTSLVQLDEKVPIVPIIPELVWHKMLLILQMSPMGVQWNLFTVLIIQRHNFFINCIPNIIEGKKVSQNCDLMSPFLLSCLKLVVTSFTNAFGAHTLDRLRKKIPLLKTIDTRKASLINMQKKCK